jgi:5-methylcytosine-specific restriction endonuclease McrA
VRKLIPPTHKVRVTLALCTERIQGEDFKTRADSIADELEEEETRYNQVAEACELYTVAVSTHVGAVTKDEMISLYDQRLSKKGHPAREVYDSIRAGAKFNKCPLCGHRDVSTLDHYLPKSKFPAFAITPINLVPSCGECNKTKLTATATDAGEQMLHPYFDDFTDGVWLRAQVVEVEPTGLLFFVVPPDGWSELRKRRIAEHFSKLELADLYGPNAAQELANISGDLGELADSGGPEIVKAHLERQWRSRASSESNSWQSAMYAALANSEWFWIGGHRSIRT